MLAVCVVTNLISDVILTLMSFSLVVVVFCSESDLKVSNAKMISS